MYSEQYSPDEYMKMPYEYMKILYEFTLEAWRETPIDNCSFIIIPKSLSIGSMSKIENGNKKKRTNTVYSQLRTKTLLFGTEFHLSILILFN